MQKFTWLLLFNIMFTTFVDKDSRIKVNIPRFIVLFNQLTK